MKRLSQEQEGKLTTAEHKIYMRKLYEEQNKGRSVYDYFNVINNNIARKRQGRWR